MKKKISIKNIIIGASLMTIFAMLVFFDYQRVQKDFRNLKNQLMNIRFESLIKNKPLVVKFKGKEMSVSDYQTGDSIEAIQIPTLKEVRYDTKLGKNMIVFERGTTDRFNTRIHGGEILLRSWLGFTKYIHVNCTGYQGRPISIGLKPRENNSGDGRITVTIRNVSTGYSD